MEWDSTPQNINRHSLGTVSKKAVRRAVRDKSEVVAMLRNHGERFFEPQKELEGAGRGQQGKSSLHLQSKERARGNRKTRSIRKLKDKDENLTSTQISWTPG